MSSAILYVAIVVIWAGVLIPRWLRRDSSDKASDDTTTVQDTPAAEETPAAAERPGPAEGRPGGWDVRPDRGAARRAADAPRGTDAPRAGGARAESDQERGRVLSARRRLLMLLLVLAVASCALADTRLAAWWVMAPPAAMLLGYLALLREAAKADAERRDPIRPMAPAFAAAFSAPAVPTPARSVPAVPDAEIIDISASVGQDGEQLYDQYADAKLRAVGD